MKFLNHNLFTGDITVNGTTTLSTATGVTRPTGDDTIHLATTAFVKAQGYAIASGTTNYISKFTGTTTLGNSQIFDNGTNVGIGTTIPVANLEIKGSATALQLTTSDYVLGSAGSRTIIGFGASTGNTYSRIQTTDAGGNSASDLILQADSGNVGIGTINPGARLQVASAASGTTMVVGRANGNSSIKAGPDANGGYLALDSNGSATIINHYTADNIWMVTGGGNVGIGTTAPGDKLEVSGNVYAAAFNSVGTLTRYNSTGGIAVAGLSGSTYAYINAYSNSGGAGKNLSLQKDGGNVGIGTTNPLQALDVRGNIRLGTVANSNTVLSSLEGGGNSIFKIKGENYVHTVVYETSYFNFEYARLTSSYSGSDTIYDLKKSDAAGVIIGTTRISTGASYFNGSVGIGNTAPSEALHVTGRIRVTTVDNGTGDFLTLSATGVITDRTAAQVLTDIGAQPLLTNPVTGTGVATRVAFWNSTSALSSSANLYWNDTNSRLGIGTASPAQALHVLGTIQAGTANVTSGVLSVFSGTDNREVWRFDNGAVVNWNARVWEPYNPATADHNFNIGHGTTGNFNWYAGTNVSISTNTFLMRLTRAGLLGINTTTPSQKLHVVGNAYITGALYDSTNSPGTAGQVLTSTATGTDWKSLSEITGVDGTGSTNFIAKWSDADTITSSQIFDNGTNLGIGTTTPSNKLQVVGTTNLLNITGAASGTTTTLFSIDGTNGRLFEVSDDLSDSLFSVNTIAGLPVMEAFSDYRVKLGPFANPVTITSNGDINLNSTGQSIKWNNINILNTTSVYTQIYTPEGIVGINIGDSLDRSNYYDNNAHSFRTASGAATLAFLNSTGLGIGTTSPAQKLHVVGTIRQTAVLSSLLKTNASGDLVAAVAGTDYQAPITNNVTGTGTATQVAFWSSTSAISGDSGLYWDNTNKRLGVGTTTPADALTVSGTFRSTSLWTTSSGVTQWGSNTTAYGILTWDTGYARIHANTGNRLDLGAGGGLHMSIATSGNVGIGTTNPAYKLDVNGTIGFAYSATNTNYIEQANGAFGYGRIRPFNASGLFDFDTNYTSGGGYDFRYNGTSLVRIASTGNVGIGTTTPSASLHISGASSAALLISGDDTRTIKITGTTSSGDQDIRFNRLGLETWTLGRDNTQNDFKLSYVANNVGGLGTGDLITVKSTGNVGIGTTSPSQKLHVDGSAYITGALYDSTNSPGTAGQVLTSTATGTDWKSLSEITGVDGTGTVNYVAKWSDADTITNSIIYDNGTNVGIGTTSPGAKLHVSGSTYIRNDNSTNQLTIDNDSVGSNAAPQYSDVLFGGYSSSLRARIRGIDRASNLARGGIILQASPDGTTLVDRLFLDGNGESYFYNNSAEVMRITSAGNVGIGTTSPAVKLHVLGSSTTELRLQNSDANNNYGFVKYETQNISGGNLVIGTNASGGGYGAMLFIADNNIDFLGGGDLRIVKSGNVGIGTYSPNEKLHVTGNIHAYAPSGIDAGLFASQAAGSTTIAIRSNGVTHFNGGNVGIGTTSPSEKLFVNVGAGALMNSTITYGTNTKGIVINQDDGGSYGAGLWFRQSGLTAGIGSVRVNSGDWATDLRFYTHPSAIINQNELYERMRINSEGNVGIGATDPLRKLHVVGNFAVNAGTGQYYGVNITGGEGTNPTILIGDWHNASANLTWDSTNRLLRIDAQYSTSGAPIVFSGNDAAIEYARFTAIGNLGIGTTSPDSLLQIGESYQTTAGTNKKIIVNIGGYYSTGSGIQYQVLGFTGTTFDESDIFTQTGGETSKNFYIGIVSDGGYFNANRFSIIGNGAERLTVKPDSGNVGIGTTSPSYKLQVNAEGNGLYVIGANSAPFTQTIASFVYGGNNNSINIENQGGKASFQARDNSNSVMNLHLNPVGGNVGIGTTSPAQKLDVQGSVSIGVSGATTVHTYYNSTTRNQIVYTNNSSFEFHEGVNERVRITAGGNVGIGTTNPTAKLEVVGQGSGSVKMGSTGFGGDWVGISLSGNLNTTDYNLLSSATNASFFLNRPTGGDMLFRHNNVDQMIIKSGGNVGIGTSAPGYKLDVNGKIYSSAEVQGGTAYMADISGVASFGSNTSTRSVRLGRDGTINDIFINGSDGYIGMGTNGPTQKLQVNGNVRVTGAYYDSNNQAGTSGQVLTSTGTGTDWKSLSEITGVDGTGTANYVAKWSDTDTITNSQIVDNGTNVGINNASPKTRLDVNGAIGFGSKSMSMTDTFATALTVNMNDHNGCYVKITAFGDWSNHSTIAYLGEFFLQASAGAYNEPGIIIRQVDNTGGGDDIQAQIVDPAGTGTRDFVIQLKSTSSTNTPFTAVLQYEVRGMYNSVS